jgi:hypothetical protein
MSLPHETGELHDVLEGQPIARVRRAEIEYVLLGTAHVSRVSAAAVTAMLGAEAFDAVAVELCEPRYTSMRDPDAFRRLEDRQFLDMSRAFAAQGGWVSGDEMARRMRRQWDQPISVLARWIVKREIVNIAWHSQILIPLFQFSSDAQQIRLVVRAALAELKGVFDDWEIAAWFAQTNVWLGEQRPLDLVAGNHVAVIEAARADRFIARG